MYSSCPYHLLVATRPSLRPSNSHPLPASPGAEPAAGSVQPSLFKQKCHSFVWYWAYLSTCHGLVWLDTRCQHKLLRHSPTSTGQGRKNITKGLWVKIRTGRSLSSYRHRENRLSLGKLLQQCWGNYCSSVGCLTANK